MLSHPSASAQPDGVGSAASYVDVAFSLRIYPITDFDKRQCCSRLVSSRNTAIFEPLLERQPGCRGEERIIVKFVVIQCYKYNADA